jgi:hypothetical protein
MRTTKWFLGTALAAGMLASGILGSARADIIDYSTSGLDGSQTVNGDAVFKLTGSTLEIDLTNNTTSANMQGTADLLTALKFDLTGLTLSNGSASGETVNVNNDLTLTTPSSTELLNSGWGGGSLSGDPNEYVAAAGLNLGSGKAFDGNTNLDGAGYGVIPAISAVGNKDGFPQSGPYTYGTATLTFTVTGTGTLQNDLSNVTFLWGTTPDATIPSNHVTILPEPTGLMAVSLLFGALARRRGRATAK